MSLHYLIRMKASPVSHFEKALICIGISFESKKERPVSRAGRETGRSFFEKLLMREIYRAGVTARALRCRNHNRARHWLAVIIDDKDKPVAFDLRAFSNAQPILAAERWVFAFVIRRVIPGEGILDGFGSVRR